MKFFFKNHGKNGSLVVKNGKISSIDITCNKSKSLLKDLIDLTSAHSINSIEQILQEIGLLEIEIITRNAEKIDAALIDANFYGTILILQNNQPLLRKGYGHKNIEQNNFNKATTFYHCGHLSEVLASLVFARLEEKGEISLDSCLDSYFPADCIKWPHLSSISVNMLLHHTSGFGGIYKRSTPIEDELPTRLQLNQFFRQDLLFQPGTFYYHSFMNFRILAAILETITDLPYSELVKEFCLKEVFVEQINQTATHYESDGKTKKLDHLSMRTCFDDMVATTEGLIELYEKSIPYLSKKTSAKVFQKNELITEACGMRCDFIFGKRVYYRIEQEAMIYCIPKDDMQIALIANKPMSEEFPLKKLISLVTTNQF